MGSDSPTNFLIEKTRMEDRKWKKPSDCIS